jgi:hypothetical protein
MRIAHACLLLSCLLIAPNHLALAGQQTKYGVTVKAVQPALLAKARTYVWTPSRATFDKEVDRMIVAAVDRELGARGFMKVASGRSDVVVTYDALGRTDLDLKSKPSADGTLREISVGTLVVELSDPTNREALFHVRMDTPIQRDRATIGAEIDAIVTAMFEKYPSPSKR